MFQLCSRLDVLGAKKLDSPKTITGSFGCQIPLSGGKGLKSLKLGTWFEDISWLAVIRPSSFSEWWTWRMRRSSAAQSWSSGRVEECWGSGIVLGRDTVSSVAGSLTLLWMNFLCGLNHYDIFFDQSVNTTIGGAFASLCFFLLRSARARVSYLHVFVSGVHWTIWFGLPWADILDPPRKSELLKLILLLKEYS